MPTPESLDLSAYRIVLASKSPRRHELLKALGIEFEIRTREVDESFPETLRKEEIAEYLASKKCEAFLKDLASDELLITSDTIVCSGNRVLNKPANAEEAAEMIASLSGKWHEVVTGVCLATLSRQRVFSDITKVRFAKLEPEEIRWYISNFKPFDKAGGYGIQEWIGYAGIERIEGSFYNVVGLPTRKLYAELKKF